MIKSDYTGCLLSARFGWSTSDEASRWSTPQQAYAYHTVPYNRAGSEAAYPYSVIDTRLRVRGQGKCCILHYENDGDKDFELLGWAVPFVTKTEG